jgi:hypothetical protein
MDFRDALCLTMTEKARALKLGFVLCHEVAEFLDTRLRGYDERASFMSLSGLSNSVSAVSMTKKASLMSLSGLSNSFLAVSMTEDFLVFMRAVNAIIFMQRPQYVIPAL